MWRILAFYGSVLWFRGNESQVEGVAVAESSHFYSLPWFLIALPETTVEASSLIYDWSPALSLCKIRILIVITL